MTATKQSSHENIVLVNDETPPLGHDFDPRDPTKYRFPNGIVFSTVTKYFSDNHHLWKTERCYSSAYERLPESPGVYAIVHRWRHWASYLLDYRVLYVGMTLNLKRRCKNHPIYYKIRSQVDPTEGDVVFYFQEKREESLRPAERILIQKFNPPYNIQNRKRGAI